MKFPTTGEHRNRDESVKNPFWKQDFMQQLQQTCYESIWSRSICHPSHNVPVPALRFCYLVQSHFVVFQPSLLISSVFGCHSILVRRISWSLLSTLDLFLFYHHVLIFFFSPWHPSSFQLAGHRALLYENSLDLKGRSEVAPGGWRMRERGLGRPTGPTFMPVLSVTVKARHRRLASHQLLIVCLLLIDTG